MCVYEVSHDRVRKTDFVVYKMVRKLRGSPHFVGAYSPSVREPQPGYKGVGRILQYSIGAGVKAYANTPGLYCYSRAKHAVHYYIQLAGHPDIMPDYAILKAVVKAGTHFRTGKSIAEPWRSRDAVLCDELVVLEDVTHVVVKRYHPN